MTVIDSILSPTFLISGIDLIALLIGATLLVLFSDFVNKRIVFPIAHIARSKTYATVKKRSKSSGFSKYLSEAVATIIFLLYIYFGTKVLAEYVFVPILVKLQSVILIVVLVLFFLLSYVINNALVRKKFMKF